MAVPAVCYFDRVRKFVLMSNWALRLRILFTRSPRNRPAISTDGGGQPPPDIDPAVNGDKADKDPPADAGINLTDDDGVA